MENEKTQLRNIIIIVVIVILAIVLLIYGICYMPSNKVQSISGYTYCNYYNGNIGDVFICANFDDFEDSIGKVKIIKFDFKNNKIIAEKDWN
jgi:hypothetical protein